MSKEEKDEFIKQAGEASSEDFEAYYNDMKESYDEIGVRAKASKTPELGGLLGLILAIVGIILLIVGAALKSKKQKTSVPPPQGEHYDYDYGYDRGRDYYSSGPPPTGGYDREAPPRRREVTHDSWQEGRRERADIPKFCPECGDRTGGKRFCTSCGEKLF